MTSLFVERPSSIEGAGCFAVLLIRTGRLVERWEGERVTRAELQRIVDDGKYYSAVAVGEDEHLLFNVVDPASVDDDLNEGSGTGGFNHSCDSNLWLQDAVTIVARRDIAAGEELTLDYTLVSSDPAWTMSPCNCGSRLCRGTVTGNDWQLPKLQRRYAGHYSPFLNHRIAKFSPSPRKERGPGGEV